MSWSVVACRVWAACVLLGWMLRRGVVGVDAAPWVGSFRVCHQVAPCGTLDIWTITTSPPLGLDFRSSKTFPMADAVS
jgi:hypothetical protein